MNEVKQRHGCVSAWLWWVIIVNLCMSIYYAVIMFNHQSGNQSFGFGLMAIFSLSNVLGSILLMRWNKFGFYLFFVNAVLASIVNVTMLHLSTVTVLWSFFVIILWWGTLHIKKNGISAWKLMEGGWGYKHCRHLYQLFGVIAIVLLVLSFVASSQNGERFGYSNYQPLNKDKVIKEKMVKSEPVKEIVWAEYSDSKKSCSIEAPNDFREAQLNEDQVLGLLCTNYDPAIVVIQEPASAIHSIGINSSKQYADVIVKINQKNGSTSNFKKISEKA